MTLASPAAAKKKPPVSVALKGGVVERGTVCGKLRVMRTTDPGGRMSVAARVRLKRARSSVLERSRCVSGRWVLESRQRLGRGLGRHTGPIDSSRPGEYRLRLLVKRKRRPGRAGQLRYLRVRGSTPAPPPGGVVDVPVSFAVENLNRTPVPCSSDGAAYQVSGRLIGPRAALEAPGSAVTLHLHGLGFGEFFWSFDAPAGYDYAAAQAAAGRTSVVIDRLGYDASGHPEGNGSCLGSQADVAHQIVEALRGGGYALGAAPGAPPAPVAFSRVALAGHSAGGAIAQIEAYSFADIDALIVMSYADQDSSQTAQSELVTTGQVCLTGGEPAEPGGPGGYAYFGQTPEDFEAAMFHDADPQVVATATALRNRDPCGDSGSIVQAIVTNQLNLDTVTVPVLLVSGADDALFPPEAVEEQAGHFSGSDDVSVEVLANTGHVLTLERTAPAFRGLVNDWLEARSF